MLRTLFISLLCLLGTTRAQAWGPKGHDVVAYIAECNLTPEAAEKIDKILGGASMVYWTFERSGRQLRSRTVLRPGEQSPCSLGQLPARSGPQVELYGVAKPARPPHRRGGGPNPIRHTARLVQGEQCDLPGDIRCDIRRQRSFLRLYRYVCPGNRAAIAAWRTPPGRSAERDIRIALSSVKGNRKKAVAIRASAFWLSEIYSS